MRLSYILPVYNVQEYVLNCLSSLRNQCLDRKEYEIICVNDGSTDRSCEIIETFCAENPDINVKIISTVNSGQAHARNIGIEIAMGQYLFFVDSDDYIASQVVGRLLDEAERLDVDMLYFDSKYVSAEENYHEPKYIEMSQNQIYKGKDYFANNFPGNGPWLFLIRRAFVLKQNIRFVEGHYCEDGMYAVLSTNKAERVTYRHVDVYRYVKREDSTITRKTHEHAAKMINDFLFAIDYIDAFILKEKLDENKSDLYIKRLSDRRNSYTFFLLVRMMRAKISRKKREEIIRFLKQKTYYPYSSIAKDYDRKIGFVSELFRFSFIYRIISSLYTVLC